ncbi:Zn-ribbon domain-containing OB-fold protein [Ornithinimicrobium faecis]|uniref:Zn-ribbon domain-containing OB-fold protein n=1 Tax=Ornithinimicrobium faecis TaxID=2934158 RepID=UPI002118205A|nr:Zn-ribbon domain-containing OB-fold protein [Ornithinimicrobium sp. HY1745]
MSDYDVPPADEVTAPWWEATREHRLLVQRCAACQTLQHPPRALCTGCGSTDDLGWETSTGAGSVDAYTVVHRSPLPELEAPYVVARVRLAEGPLVLTHVLADDLTAVRADLAVRLDWHDLPDGRSLPVFRIDDSAQEG